MDEKKVTKISLSTFFLILAIMVIIVMSYFLYKFYNEKTIEIQKSKELTAEIEGLQSTTNNLQEKLETISNTLNSNSTTTTNNTNTTKTTKTTTTTNTTNTTKTTTNNNTNTNEKKENESTKNTPANTNNKSVKYEYSSADRAAMQGYPKILKVYELTNNELNFNYNGGFDFNESTMDREITATAKAIAEQLYEFEENVSGHQYKMTFKFDEDQVTIYEYDNGEELGYATLWR